MRFNEAFIAMRKKKLVKRPCDIFPITIREGRIVYFYKAKNGKLRYEFVNIIPACDIIAGDWELVDG